MNVIRQKTDANGDPMFDINGDPIYEPSITLGMITEYDDNDIKDELTALRKKLSALEILPDKIGLIAGLFEPIYETDANGNIIKYQVDEDNNFVLDDNGNKIPDPNGKPNVIDYKKITAAEIYAAINEDGSTAAGISADHIFLDGEVTLSSKLTTFEADITNAVVGKIEAGEAIINNATIKGELHYSKILGKITTVTQSTTLEDDAYFVIAQNTNYNNYITITFPRNPSIGQTLFIGGEVPYY